MSTGDLTHLTLREGRASLPRGPHALPSEEVATSQRGRMLQAVAEVVAERGYAAATVGDVIGKAGVSRGAFYALFTDKQDAFLAAYEKASGQVADRVTGAIGGDGDWIDRHRAAIAAYLGALRSSPSYARSFIVEARAAGPAAQAIRDRMLDRYAAAIDRTARSARQQRGLPALGHDVLVGLAASVDELINREIRAGRLERLDDLVTPLLHLHVSALVGPEVARDRAPLDA